MLHFILALICVFMSGMAMAVTFLPWLIDFIRRKTMTTSERVEYLLEKSAKYNAKKVKESDVFKKRLDAILKAIEEASKAGQKRIIVTYMENCHTDKEIRNELRERDFETSTNCDGPNSLRIRWSDRR